ncbi:NAD(P)-dependent dehydrogenase (short-subunit alcohol dehydrogenase family) [Amycolatopsis bartoniae]|uniref:Oxidoreductase n=1 Tax=Amycolatopsis bartoniae TaxID=941986 RepID=A0A8H9J1M5_9PSEU|nr:SDR family oxidoreductase [Amycolatopsis bartoniae]MBB2935187.1 NAD(P)-dependent dehydrogenase (short-subunit alcohol dehydrogenase family) [Amycolatopsis bartoniae]TVS99383.1 SDR family oxidoreductase [Amycolatopsis bartoniae]GHF74977.1 oxidoreductase [Amycolatopsis bartoniae]
MGKLEGKTAVVTGGGTGIGLATAARLAAEGAHVFITGRREDMLAHAVESIGSEVTAVPGDISDPADLDRLYAAVRDRGQGLDVLFANAATAVFAPLAQATAEQFEQIFGVNVLGTLRTVQKALPLLNDGASVVLNASIRADDGWADYGLYAASKAAVQSLGRTWANELKDRAIRVNVVSPGAIDTAGVDTLIGAENAAAAKKELAAGVPIGRLGRAEEVAAAVAFLASADSSFVLGTTLYVDGGEKQF